AQAASPRSTIGGIYSRADYTVAESCGPIPLNFIEPAGSSARRHSDRPLVRRSILPGRSSGSGSQLGRAYSASPGYRGKKGFYQCRRRLPVLWSQRGCEKRAPRRTRGSSASGAAASMLGQARWPGCRRCRAQNLYVSANVPCRADWRGEKRFENIRPTTHPPNPRCSLESLRFFESRVCAFLLMEMSQILAPTLQHDFVNWQDLQLNHIIIGESDRSINETACLQ